MISSSRGTMSQRSTLSAGPLSLVYERAGIRWVRFGSHEILRGIYVGVRDANWRTINPEVRDLKIQADADSFHITFVAQHQHLDLDFLWNGTIIGEPDGALSITMDGVAMRSFLKNRIGFCVLHPDSCAGRPCTVEHVDGHIASTSFPSLVSPHQAFMNVRALAHEVTPGVIAEVRVDGDIFETEDQRNWSDTSFKTYGTPVDLPFPVEVPAGTRIRQDVHIRLRGAAPVASAMAAAMHVSTAPDIVSIEATDATVPLPRIGLMIDATRALLPRECDRLELLAPSHLRVDLDLSTPAAEWQAMLGNAAIQAGVLGARLHVAALVSSADAGVQLAALADAAPNRGSGGGVDTWLVFDRATGTTSASLIARARDTLGAHGPIQLGGGSDKHFADLNRNRPPMGLLDLLSFPSSPQAHADDVETMVENVGSVGTVIKTARGFAGMQVPIDISPVTLKPRARAGAPSPPPLGSLPDHIDARQGSPFAAAWTISHLRACAGAGVASVTYFRTVGPDGVMNNDGVFPVYRVLADVAPFAGGQVLVTRSTQPTRVDALFLERDGIRRRILVNLRPEPQRVQVSGSTFELDAYEIKAI